MNDINKFKIVIFWFIVYFEYGDRWIDEICVEIHNLLKIMISFQRYLLIQIWFRFQNPFLQDFQQFGWHFYWHFERKGIATRHRSDFVDETSREMVQTCCISGRHCFLCGRSLLSSSTRHSWSCFFGSCYWCSLQRSKKKDNFLILISLTFSSLIFESKWVH